MTFSLLLDSDTSMCFYLKPGKDYDGEVKALLEGSGENAAVKRKDGRYKAVVPSISAHNLGHTYRIQTEAGGAFTIEASALSYANMLLNAPAYRDNTAARYAMTALYRNAAQCHRRCSRLS